MIYISNKMDPDLCRGDTPMCSECGIMVALRPSGLCVCCNRRELERPKAIRKTFGLGPEREAALERAVADAKRRQGIAKRKSLVCECRTRHTCHRAAYAIVSRDDSTLVVCDHCTFPYDDDRDTIAKKLRRERIGV